jgi:polysaccharide export outer membrane protein
MCTSFRPPSSRSVLAILSFLALLSAVADRTEVAAQVQQSTAAGAATVQPSPGATPASGGGAPRPASPRVEVPAEYVIGPEDVLGINFWRDADMTGDVTVRPDGRITLPLIGDINAVGLTPEALKAEITTAAKKLIEDPSVTVIVRAINSRKVFITGQVATPNAYPLTRDLTVMQLITLAGGLTEYADKKNITVLRNEAGRQQTFKFNYGDVSKGKNLAQNIVLRPGDTVVVP